MILLIAKDSFGHGDCPNTCLGPVTKVKLTNDYGNLYVDRKNNVRTNGSYSKTIYKISSGTDFYLYDPQTPQAGTHQKAGRFVCWNDRWQKMRHRKKPLVGRKYLPKKKEYCKFIDKPIQQGYVKLVPSFNTNLKMMFNAKGTPTNKHSKYPKRERFLMQVQCECFEAKQHFCETPVGNFVEFKNICHNHNTI